MGAGGSGPRGSWSYGSEAKRSRTLVFRETVGETGHDRAWEPDRDHGLTCPASRAWVTLEAELPQLSAEP